ncbi:GtrA family protein [Bacillus ginsengihumi]|uniref:GtrA family protein n=1 Tax=Heyndrickxia ginsengihumi TaxID=363870 RepID=A0A0A6VFL5_9BACI|nr:GtrA family protein [Heyndrickxia ginsengihumi]KHD85404.1 membrane protein [Heyndrickxia ginsengihumi]MBE6184869.1 GtrA family protein [Bacillus sp. (in: firmicutes)]MCM3024891.1 GtrA family protein [Heyndrickxia ginsengihumi]NEY19083.1 GtrA family protein [Heyndrickxia ginsengihumi]
MFDKLRQLCKFGIVGIANTLIDCIVFFILTTFHIEYLVAQACSYSAGMVNSYILNRSWTFQVRKKASFQEMIRFIVINVIVYGITSLLLFIFHQQMHMPLMIAKLGATVAGIAVNFIGSRLWVFQVKHQKEGI